MPGVGGITKNAVNSAPGALSAGYNAAIGSLGNALNSNSQAYGGLVNQAQQQYQQNAGAVQQHLANSGLGNTTIADTMSQAPLQTLNNSLLNITGRQQGAAAGIYGHEAGLQGQYGDQMANLLQAIQGQNMQNNELNLSHSQQPAIGQGIGSLGGLI